MNLHVPAVGAGIFPPSRYLILGFYALNGFLIFIFKSRGTRGISTLRSLTLPRKKNSLWNFVCESFQCPYFCSYQV